jgi:UDP-3-O-[3-hydroxymyristoyl] N-acetylglucosamine deacetylase
MLFGNQRTIHKSISCFGVGVHSGDTINMRLCPAEAGTGVVFKKVDAGGEFIGYVQASYDRVSSTTLNTTISSEDGKVTIATIEHLMAALWGCGIDNILIEINGNELPIMDGSSEHFVFMIECAGIYEQHAGRKIIEVLKKVEVNDGFACASISPSDSFSVSMEIDFKDTIISKQKYFFDSNHSSFKKELCRARTFGFLHEVEQLRKMGLAKGGSLDNAIVISEDKILNEEGLRYRDEFVRHKALDSIGDLYLAGGFIKGHFEGIKSGHKIHNELLSKFFATEDAWRIVEVPESHKIAVNQ